MTTTQTIPANPLLANLICMASMMIWAAGLPAADVIIGTLPPLVLAALRMSIAALVLLPIWLALDGLTTLRRADWRRGIVVGGIGFGLGSFLIIFAQGRTDAVTVSVISATMPVVGIALECLFDGRKLSPTLILGIALGLVGGIIAFDGRMGTLGFGIGALAAFGSVLYFAWGSRATVHGFSDLTPIGRTTITLVGAAIATTAVALFAHLFGAPTADWAAMGPREIGALLIYAMGALALSQVLWIISVGQLGIGLASLHLNATPFYVMILLFALGGDWVWMQALGAAIVGLGVLVAQGLLRKSN